MAEDNKFNPRRCYIMVYAIGIIRAEQKKQATGKSNESQPESPKLLTC